LFPETTCYCDEPIGRLECVLPLTDWGWCCGRYWRVDELEELGVGVGLEGGIGVDEEHFIEGVKDGKRLLDNGIEERTGAGITAGHTEALISGDGSLGSLELYTLMR
jgi:hypothetical protein